MIYLDHAATCPMRETALLRMTEAMKNTYGNASPSYPAAQQAKAQLDQARTVLAETIGADWREIFFTSGGTEGDNWALIGAAEASELVQPGTNGADSSNAEGMPGTRGHIITTAIEHHAVLHTCAYLESRGFTVSYLPVDGNGMVRAEDLHRELDLHPDTFLVSVMMANNEVGTIEPIRELVRTVRDWEKERNENGFAASRGKAEKRDEDAARKRILQRRILFHTDAVQAYGKIPIDVKTLDVDLLSVSAHKLGGPKGIGFLYLKKGTQIGALIHGGSQESGRRAGTENVPAAIGFAAAAKEAVREMETDGRKVLELAEYFHENLEKTFGNVTSGEGGVHCVWNGPDIAEGRSETADGERGAARDAADLGELCRIPGNVNVAFPGLDQRTLLMNLDLVGICASGGSACTTGAVEPSHVILSMTGDRKRAEGALRFTLGPENTREELDTVIRVLKETIERICVGATGM